MTVHYVEYPLERGYIHHWLVAGPQAIPVENLEDYRGPDFKLQIARAEYARPGAGVESGISTDPVEPAEVVIGDFKTRWQYYRCLEDHYVDLSAFYHTTHYLRAWAYTQVAVPNEQTVTLVLTTNGPADVWINGRHCHRQEHFHHQHPLSVPFKATLQPGDNKILVRFEEVAARECPYVMALQIADYSGAGEAFPLPVRLPTTLDVAHRQEIEEGIEAAYLERDVYSYTQEVRIHWPESLTKRVHLCSRLQTLEGRIYSESVRKVKPGFSVSLGQGVQFLTGEYRLVVMPYPREYYEANLRIKRQIPLRVLQGRFSTQPYGTYAERRVEALQAAVTYSGLSIFADAAAMALGWWSRVDVKTIMKAIDSINRRADCSDFYLCGLLGMLTRYGDDPSFPEAIRQPLQDCILNFKYWLDEPGDDAMCYTTENHSILFHTCQVLAGQLYPDKVFNNNGQTGQWHREMGERRALDWLYKRAESGFHEWDSNCYFEEDILALTHLADLAEDQTVWEMATVVLDKMLFTMAVNSFKGVFGSTHGHTYTPFIKGAALEATSGISRLAWGMGAFNHHIMGVVALASSDYEIPPIIEAIAADLPEEMWNREHHGGTEQDFAASGSVGSGIDKVTYKTPDYMLCSAQDWNAGQPGYQQHIWQATFGPEAVVFVTHPKCSSEEGSHRPNFWHGNAVLPRVAQWKDVLVAVHRLPDDDWMGFTHAYFPVCSFDAWELRDGWAFAQKDNGYIALTAARGIELVERGNNAYRELRSYGLRNVWLVQMGRAALDGDFAAFQEKVLSQPVAFEDLAVRYQTLSGQDLAFGWEGPLLLDGKEQPITGFKHYENPYCEADLPAKQLEIRYGDEMMRLTFENVREE